jgi:Holliday junction resolvasome RuvABC endonuclease subunit
LKTPGELIGPLAMELARFVDPLLPGVDVVAYERPLVRHPHAAQMLNGFAWVVELICAERELLCLPIVNTRAKKFFVGKTYSKKDKPYPGIVRAHQLGVTSVKTTDEADALAIHLYVQDLIKRGDVG